MRSLTSSGWSAFCPADCRRCVEVIHTAKVTTIVGLATPALVLQITSSRVVLHLSLYISYCIWWLLEQLLLPSLRRQLFTESLCVLGLIATVLYVGLLYCLAGWLATADPYAGFEIYRQNSWRLLPGIW